MGVSQGFRGPLLQLSKLSCPDSCPQGGSLPSGPSSLPGMALATCEAGAFPYRSPGERVHSFPRLNPVVDNTCF